MVQLLKTFQENNKVQKKCIFNACLNSAKVSLYLISYGRMFQSLIVLGKKLFQ